MKEANMPKQPSLSSGIVLLLAVALGIFLGCAKTQQPENTTAPAPPGAPNANPMAAPGPPGGPGAPAGAPAGGTSGADTGAAPHPELAKKVSDLEAAYAKNPSDAATKKQLATATYEYGHTLMMDPQLSPRVKYRAALKEFRRVLELDPNHQQAASEKAMIESIYRQMGRPVPQ
jgi:tetratricopeptide (TPR) repeat protein